MLQLSKVKKSRDEWKKKAKKKTKELWEMRKVLKYYRNRVANLIGENKRLRAELKELKEKEIKSNEKKMIHQL
jgi:chromosome segregation ATPase